MKLKDNMNNQSLSNSDKAIKESLLDRAMKEYSEKQKQDNEKKAEEGYKITKVTHKKNRLVTIYGVTIIVILLAFTSSMILFRNIMNGMDDTKHEAEKDKIRYEFNTIMKAKTSLDSQITVGLKDMSKDIVDDINSSNIDMDSLEISLTNGEVPDELDAIFSKYLMNKSFASNDTERDSIFIAKSDVILADYSKMYDSEYDGTRTWEKDIEAMYNQDLGTSTYTKIINQDLSEPLIFEYDANDEISSEYNFTNLDENTLRLLYEKYGIEGFKNMIFLVPVYIYDNGDIFGKSDVHQGAKVDTNKMILVQRYSLYDYIVSNNVITEFAASRIVTNIDYLQSLCYIFAIGIIISMVIIIVFLLMITNNIIDKLKNGQALNRDPNNAFGRRSYDLHPDELISYIRDEIRRQEEGDSSKEDKEKKE